MMKAVVLLALLCAAYVSARNNDAVMHFIGNRQYEVENPKQVTGSPAMLIFYHGHGGWCDHPGELEDLYNQVKAQGVNLLVIAPCGIDHGWDTTAYGIDWTFTNQMIADCKTKYNIDTKKIYIAGFSQGGMMTSVLACEHADMFVAASMLDGGFDCNKLKQPIHIQGIEGMNDNPMSSSAYGSFARAMGCNAGSGDDRSQVCNGKYMNLHRIPGVGHWWVTDNAKNMIAFYKKTMGGVTTCSVASEGDSVALDCGDKAISDVKFASYGTPSGSCAAGFSVSSTCDASTTMAAVRTACLGKSSCSVAATNAVFGDPCSGVGKKLAVSVECAVKPVTCGVATEGASLSLKCAGNAVIKSVDFASYGTPSGSCDANFTPSSCHAATSKTVVEGACLGKSSCAVDATNAVFGDPCSGTLKQLAAKVTCA